MELVRQVCSIKALVTWHAADVARTCRERCGGQGYLTVNRIAGLVEGAHAGMTAEGDNSVLMQKVAKEMLSDLQTGLYSPPSHTISSTNHKFNAQALTNLDILFELIKFREGVAVSQLTEALTSKMGQGRKLFDIWMGEESDKVQKAALAYGERIVLEGTMNLLSGKDTADP